MTAHAVEIRVAPNTSIGITAAEKLGERIRAILENPDFGIDCQIISVETYTYDK